MSGDSRRHAAKTPGGPPRANQPPWPAVASPLTFMAAHDLQLRRPRRRDGGHRPSHLSIFPASPAWGLGRSLAFRCPGGPCSATTHISRPGGPLPRANHIRHLYHVEVQTRTRLPPDYTGGWKSRWPLSSPVVTHGGRYRPRLHTPTQRRGVFSMAGVASAARTTSWGQSLPAPGSLSTACKPPFCVTKPHRLGQQGVKRHYGLAVRAASHLLPPACTCHRLSRACVCGTQPGRVGRETQLTR